MREFTDEEWSRLKRGRCPMCGIEHPLAHYMRGPRGGASINLRTPCGHWINVVNPDLHGWPPVGVFGQVIDD